VKPQGRRRRALEASFVIVIDSFLSGRILAFDAAAAAAAARARAIQKRRGLAASLPDNQIAGIALAHECTIATGDVGDFAHLGIPLLNPWEVGARE
jgi:hypothetical protein